VEAEGVGAKSEEMEERDRIDDTSSNGDEVRRGDSVVDVVIGDLFDNKVCLRFLKTIFSSSNVLPTKAAVSKSVIVVVGSIKWSEESGQS
jgi:hypothetical protein